MNLSCESTGVGHRFGNNFLFRHLDFRASAGEIAFLAGPNGSGKSTLMKILTGGLEPLEGTVWFEENGLKIPAAEAWHRIGFAAPYQELPESFTLSELIAYQRAMEPEPEPEANFRLRMERFGLSGQENKYIRFFSTGMKQKARFVLNLGENRPFWFLDEPGSNLDEPASAALWEWLQLEKDRRLLVVASNDPRELQFAAKPLRLGGR